MLPSLQMSPKSVSRNELQIPGPRKRHEKVDLQCDFDSEVVQIRDRRHFFRKKSNMKKFRVKLITGRSCQILGSRTFLMHGSGLCCAKLSETGCRLRQHPGSPAARVKPE